MPAYVIGLDIGHSSVKAAVLKGSYRGWEVEDFLTLALEEEGLPDGPSPAGEASDEEGVASLPAESAASLRRAALVRALDAIVKAVGHESAVVVAAVPAGAASTWLIDLPFSDPKRIAETIEFEVENYVPWDLDDVVLDYAVLEPGGAGTRVLTSMVPRRTLRKTLNLLQEGGADPKHLCVDALELARLVPADLQGAHVILDVGASRTLACVVQDGKPRWTRSLELGASDFPVHEQEQVDGTTQLVQATPTAWMARIRATLLAAEESGAPEIDGVLLTGGGSRWHNLGAEMHEDLGVPVHQLPLPDSEVNADVAPRPEPEHALAMALALRAFADRKELALDFRVGDFAYHAANRMTARLVAAALAAGVLLGIGRVGNHAWQMHKLNAQLEAANQRLVSSVQAAFPQVAASSLMTPDAGIAVAREQVTALELRAAALEGFPLTALGALKELSQTVPSGVTVDVDEYIVNDEMIRIRGTTDSFGSVDQIESAIQAKPEFRGAKKSDVNKGPTKDGVANMRFTVTAPREFDEETEG